MDIGQKTGELWMDSLKFWEEWAWKFVHLCIQIHIKYPVGIVVKLLMQCVANLLLFNTILRTFENDKLPQKKYTAL